MAELRIEITIPTWNPVHAMTRRRFSPMPQTKLELDQTRYRIVFRTSPVAARASRRDYEDWKLATVYQAPVHPATNLTRVQAMTTLASLVQSLHAEWFHYLMEIDDTRPLGHGLNHTC